MRCTLTTALFVTLATLCFSCDRKESAQSTPANTPSTATPVAAPKPQPAPAPPSTPAPAPTPASASQPPAADANAPLPKAEDVLPEGEVSRGSVVVFGDNYRFQVKPFYKPVSRPDSKIAYQGTVDGILGPADITCYVTKEPFTGDSEALLKRQEDAVKAKGGKVNTDLGGDDRFLAVGDGKIDMQRCIVSDGNAYVFHAETPDKNNAFANVGSDLAIRASTFHVGPPPKK